MGQQIASRYQPKKKLTQCRRRSPAKAAKDAQYVKPQLRDATEYKLDTMRATLKSVTGRVLLKESDHEFNGDVEEDRVSNLDFDHMDGELVKYDDDRVKPPECWHLVLTEHNVFAKTKSMKKQIEFAKLCIGRVAADVLAAGKLQMLVDRIEPANDLMQLLVKKAGPKPTFLSIKGQLQKCVDNNAKFYRGIMLRILGLYLTDMVTTLSEDQELDIELFHEHWVPVPWTAMVLWIRSHSAQALRPRAIVRLPTGFCSRMLSRSCWLEKLKHS